jgi:predicted dehydrogenase
MADKIRLGIVGYGGIGSFHADNVLQGKCPEIELTAVADINPDRLQQIKEVAPHVQRFENAESMYKSGICDAVLIATPHFDHPELSMLAFEHGLHVMCEKPSGVFTKKVREMNAAAEKSGLVFGVMFCVRTDHIYRKVKELVSSNTFGEIRRVSWIVTNCYRPQAYYNSGGWRATWSGEGGGVLLNQCPHHLDILQWICGMPQKVTAKLYYGKWHDIEVEDDVSAILEFENGATGTFIASTGDFPGTCRLEITLDKGKILAEDGKITLWELDEDERSFSKNNKKIFAGPGFSEKVIETDGKSEAHVGVLNAFAGAILRGDPLVAEGHEGIFELAISNAMHLSDWLNKTIELPLDEDLFYAELQKRMRGSRRKTDPAKNIVAKDMSSSFTMNARR